MSFDWSVSGLRKRVQAVSSMRFMDVAVHLPSSAV